MRKASTGSGAVSSQAAEEEALAEEVIVLEGLWSKFSLIGEEGGEEEKKLVKLFERRMGTKVLGLLDGERTLAGTSLVAV